MEENTFLEILTPLMKCLDQILERRIQVTQMIHQSAEFIPNPEDAARCGKEMIRNQEKITDEVFEIEKAMGAVIA